MSSVVRWKLVSREFGMLKPKWHFVLAPRAVMALAEGVVKRKVFCATDVRARAMPRRRRRDGIDRLGMCRLRMRW